MKKNKICAVFAAVLVSVSSGMFSVSTVNAYAEIVNDVSAAAYYPEAFTEYTEFLEEYPENYRVDEESVYFVNSCISSTQLELIVSSNQESSVDRNTYGCIFKPEEDGRYVVTVREYIEEIVECDNSGHFHYFYPVLKNFVIDAADGEINVELQGSRSWYSEEQIALESEKLMECDAVGACYDVIAEGSENGLDETYFSYVNSQLPDDENGYDRYIMTIYGEYSAMSYFCSEVSWLSPADLYIPRVILSDETIGEICPVMTTSGYASPDLYESTCDAIEFYRVHALEDGDVTITVDDERYHLTIEDGVFHYADVSELSGDVNNDGRFSVIDVIMLRKWLIGAGDVTCWENGDICSDGRINIFDLCAMEQMLFSKNESTAEPMLLIMDYQIILDENGWGGQTFVEVIDTDGFIHLQESDMSPWDFDVNCFLEEADNIISDTVPSSSVNKSDIAEIQEFAENAYMYQEYEMAEWDFCIDDYGEETLYAVHQDENGAYKALELCRFGGECAWLDNADVQEFVTMLIKNGYYADKSSFEFFLENYR